jgi:hypothetical protein
MRDGDGMRSREKHEKVVEACMIAYRKFQPLAVDEALKKHKNQVVKKSEEKKAAAVVAAQKKLEAQMFPDNHMDVDMDLAVKYLYSILFSS